MTNKWSEAGIQLKYASGVAGHNRGEAASFDARAEHSVRSRTPFAAKPHHFTHNLPEPHEYSGAQALHTCYKKTMCNKCVRVPASNAGSPIVWR